MLLFGIAKFFEGAEGIRDFKDFKVVKVVKVLRDLKEQLRLQEFLQPQLFGRTNFL